MGLRNGANRMGLPDGAAGSARVLHGVPGEAEGTVWPRDLEASPCVSPSQGPPGKCGGVCIRLFS